MPLPSASETAARRVARTLAALDADLVDYIVDGGSLPTTSSWIARVRDDVRAVVAPAMREIDPDVTDGEIAAVVAGQLASIERAIDSSISSARNARRRARARRVVQNEDESDAVFAARVGAFVALAVISSTLSAAAKRRRIPVEQIARRVGARLPRRVSPYARMVVRTETAIARNVHGADVVDRLNASPDPAPRQQSSTGRHALLVLDARKGPTDHECERVNGRYASPGWVRANPVEHPNCTRLARPVVLPSNRRITLLE